METDSKDIQNKRSPGKQLQWRYIVTEPKHWQHDQKPQGKHIKKSSQALMNLKAL